MVEFILNNTTIKTGAKPATTLLDFIRYHQRLTGTKIGCREGDCGACTILTGELRNGKLIYSSATSCLMPLGNAHGKHIVTIEGLNLPDELNAVQRAFAAEGATQCGFCTPGFIVSLCGYCVSEGESSYSQAIDSINGNICRCTGYKSIERAVTTINTLVEKRNSTGAIEFAVESHIIPSYFAGIKKRLGELTVNFPVTKGKIVGGGTDLYVQQHDTITEEDITLVYSRPGFKDISQSGSICEMGAGVTVSDIAASEIFKKHFPALPGMIKLVSSTPIRNMASIAGNIVNASPIGDLSIFFLALNADLHLKNDSGSRKIALRDFYKGYKVLDKTPDEWVEKISFPLPDTDCLTSFEKVSKRTHLDIASVNSALAIKMNGKLITEAGLSAGGIAAVPAFLKESSRYMSGKELTAGMVDGLLQVVQSEISPISDARGTADYKRLLLNQLVKAHFIKLFPEIGETLIHIHAEY